MSSGIHTARWDLTNEEIDICQIYYSTRTALVLCAKAFICL